MSFPLFVPPTQNQGPLELLKLQKIIRLCAITRYDCMTPLVLYDGEQLIGVYSLEVDNLKIFVYRHHRLPALIPDPCRRT